MAYTGNGFTKEEKREIIDSVVVLIGDYDIYRKYAAILLLKALLPHKIVKAILRSDDIHPFKRADKRVLKWRKEVLARGVCESCGTKKQLEAHHIIKWCDYPAGRADAKNGQCLCHKCHTEEHKGDQSYWMMKAKCKK